MTVTLKKIVGQRAEKRACDYLRKQGLQLIQENFSCKLGEIDLIMRDKEDIVFVEVRSRKATQYGSPIESVNYHKQRKIISTATYFLQKQQWLHKVDCRFDIVGISHDNIDWIKNAFTKDYF